MDSWCLVSRSQSSLHQYMLSTMKRGGQVRIYGTVNIFTSGAETLQLYSSSFQISVESGIDNSCLRCVISDLEELFLDIT